MSSYYYINMMYVIMDYVKSFIFQYNPLEEVHKGKATGMEKMCCCNRLKLQRSKKYQLQEASQM